MSSGSIAQPEIRPIACSCGDEVSASVARKTTTPVAPSSAPKRWNGGRRHA